MVVGICRHQQLTANYKTAPTRSHASGPLIFTNLRNAYFARNLAAICLYFWRNPRHPTYCGLPLWLNLCSVRPSGASR